MKEIKALIRPGKVEKIVSALQKANYHNLTIFVGEGTGSFLREDSFPSLEFHITDSEVVKIELICKSEAVDDVIRIISEYGRTKESGDGFIYVSNIERLVKVKTGLNYTEKK